MDTYIKRCNLIYELLQKNYPKHKFALKTYVKFNTVFYEIIINDTKQITLEKNVTWNLIKLLVKKKLEKRTECEICYDNMSNVSCSNCSNYFCGDCYIDIMKKNEGFIVCPFCRYTFGEKMNEQELYYSTEMMKTRFAKLKKAN